MSNPQLEDGYIKLANELIEAYSAFRIPGEAMQCLWVILRKTYGFNKLEDRISISQFTEATGLKKQHAHRAIGKLTDLNLVTKKGDGFRVTYMINKDSTKWVRQPKKVTVPKKGDCCTQKRVQKVPIIGEYNIQKDILTKESIYRVFDFWNSKKIIAHRKIEPCSSSIKTGLKTYSEQEIKKSITNYSIVLKEKKYYWTYKWTLKEFFQRGLEKFLDENTPFENYLMSNRDRKREGGRSWNIKE